MDIRPTCVRIVKMEDIDKDLLSYDAEYYKGKNDGENNIHLTTSVENEQDMEDITQ